MDPYLKANQELWDAWTPYHVSSEFYRVDSFRAGRNTLGKLELDAVGDVRGKTLLHLQCHFGLETLSWARQGAQVVGADFSLPAVQAARELAASLALPAAFVHSNIYDLPQHLEGQFDAVFTSNGVLGWLPDLDGWARVIAHFLKPGGLFFVLEVHPFVLLFDERRDDRELRLLYPYFHRDAPLEEVEEGTYAVPDAPIRANAYYWIHSLSDTIGALLRAGLVLESFEEYRTLTWAAFPWMVQREDGDWEFPPDQPELPLMFSLRARKPETAAH